MAPSWSKEGGDSALDGLPVLPTPLILSQNTTVVFDNGTLVPKWMKEATSVSRTHCDQFPSVDASSFASGIAVGLTPYEPGQWSFSETDWKELEDLCLSENFEGDSCVLFMQGGDDNSGPPLCPLNGRSL